MGTDLTKYNKDTRLALWAARIADCRNSELNVSQWCKENHISASTFYHWQRKVFDAVQQGSSNTHNAVVSAPSTGIIELPVALMPTSGGQPIAKLSKADLTADVYAGITPELMEAICRGLGHA